MQSQETRAVDFGKPELNTFYNTLSPAIKERILSVPFSEQSELLTRVKEKKEEEEKQSQEEKQDVPGVFQVEKIEKEEEHPNSSSLPNNEEKTITLKQPM